MIFSNASVLNDKFLFERRDINIVDGFVQPIAANERRIKGDDYFIIPALTDIHSHGAHGASANDASSRAYQTIDSYMSANGVLSHLSTIMTSNVQVILDICKEYTTYKRNHDSLSQGLYVEGPFISANRKGAHDERYLLPPDIELFKRMFDASEGFIKVVTVAPELPDAISFIKEASKLCKVAIGHSEADYSTAMRAFEAGAGLVTHLFNAMNPMDHRQPGIVAAARDQGAYIELICDGIHIHPAVIRMVFSGFDKDKIILISDSISATGLSDGEYHLGGLKTFVQDGESRLEDGTLAGSTTSLLECIRRAVKFGIRFEDAIRAAGKNPRDFIGLQNDRVIVLDKAMHLVTGK